MRPPRVTFVSLISIFLSHRGFSIVSPPRQASFTFLLTHALVLSAARKNGTHILYMFCFLTLIRSSHWRSTPIPPERQPERPPERPVRDSTTDRVVDDHTRRHDTHLVYKENTRSADRRGRGVLQRVDLKDHAHCRRQRYPLV